jgi:hypothetical protein
VKILKCRGVLRIKILKALMFPAGRFAHSFIASLGFKTQDVMF